jgi:ribosomal protein S18 acetylase RimI-like enzyme
MLRQPWQQPRGSEKDNLEDSAFHVMACDDKHRIVGAGRLHLTDNHQAQIRYMAVDTPYQGQGIGKLLLDELENIARKNQVTILLLHARENALNFYLKQGYELIEKSHLLFDSIQHYKMIKHL